MNIHQYDVLRRGLRYYSELLLGGGSLLSRVIVPRSAVHGRLLVGDAKRMSRWLFLRFEWRLQRVFLCFRKQLLHFGRALEVNVQVLLKLFYVLRFLFGVVIDRLFRCLAVHLGVFVSCRLARRPEEVYVQRSERILRVLVGIRQHIGLEFQTCLQGLAVPTIQRLVILVFESRRLSLISHNAEVDI